MSTWFSNNPYIKEKLEKQRALEWKRLKHIRRLEGHGAMGYTYPFSDKERPTVLVDTPGGVPGRDTTRIGYTPYYKDIYRNILDDDILDYDKVSDAFSDMWPEIIEEFHGTPGISGPNKMEAFNYYLDRYLGPDPTNQAEYTKLVEDAFYNPERFYTDKGEKTLLDFATENEDAIKRFIGSRPDIDLTYEDLMKDIKEGNIDVGNVPRDIWGTEENPGFYSYDKTTDRTGETVGGYYQKGKKGKDRMMLRGEDDYDALPHELLHYFSGHESGDYGIPEMNPYIALDMKLGGWLPSFHPQGRRPTIPGKLGDTKLGKWWNENFATKQTDISDKRGYHPWYDEEAYDSAFDEPTNYERIHSAAISSMKDRKHKRQEKWEGSEIKGMIDRAKEYFNK